MASRVDIGRAFSHNDNKDKVEKAPHSLPSVDNNRIDRPNSDSRSRTHTTDSSTNGNSRKRQRSNERSAAVAKPAAPAATATANPALMGRQRISYADIDTMDTQPDFARPTEVTSTTAPSRIDNMQRTSPVIKRARTRSRSRSRSPRGDPPRREYRDASRYERRSYYDSRSGRYDDRRDYRDRDRERERERERDRDRNRENGRDREGRGGRSYPVSEKDRRDPASTRTNTTSAKHDSASYSSSRNDAETSRRREGTSASTGRKLSPANGKEGSSASSHGGHRKQHDRGSSLGSRRSVRFASPGELLPDTNTTGSRSESPKESVATSKQAEMDEPTKPLDEAALLEERRKRREAIKAKYKGQATPLLVSALALNTPTSATPTPAENTPVTPGSPQIPNMSREESPADFMIEKTELAGEESKSQGEDDPSAADYDPNLDTEDDRMKFQRFHQGNDEVSSASYDDAKTTHDILMPESAVESSETNGKDKEPATGGDEFDMFAEGDDDDMFAPMPAKKARAINPTEAGAVVPSAQMEFNMLDDWDDFEGYYRIILGELMDGRYHVQANLGKGMFSGVVRALDNETQKLVAIKIIRNNETMRKAGQKEIDILKKLSANDPEDRKHCVRLERTFDHKNHLCLVFENLSINLREVLKKFGRDIGINLRAVRTYAQQLFLGLSLLKKCNILHADIKPDNILVNEGRNILKICDLGSASDASENEITPYLVSRFYRAPEVILGMPYDFAMDMWSVGCTLYELYTGKILFTGRTNNQMLKSMMECRGKFSQKLLRKGQFTPMHFDELLNFRSVEKDKLTNKDVVKILNFAKPTRELKPRLLASASGMREAEIRELNLFIDLLDRCLQLNPEKRITPLEALRHPFILRATKA